LESFVPGTLSGFASTRKEKILQGRIVYLILKGGEEPTANCSKYSTGIPVTNAFAASGIPKKIIISSNRTAANVLLIHLKKVILK
jgi:hypothetical protein